MQVRLILLGIVIDSRDEHPAKVEAPIFVMELGIDIDVRLLQFPKATFPIVNTLLGMLIVFKPTQP